MNDDISSTLQQLKDMLSNGQANDKLKDMLSDNQMSDKLQSLMSIIPNMQNSSENTENHQSKNNFNLSENEVMLSKFMKIMDKRKQFNDPRINLLTAIKPYLSEKRQGKIDSYSKIFNFSQIASLLKDEEF